jgi:hypothetical protein
MRSEAGRITGVLPLAHVKSMLFGHALTSLPFAVYGGVAAVDAQAARRWSRGPAPGQRLGVQHLELRHTERRHDRLAASRTVRHLPQGHPAR